MAWPSHRMARMDTSVYMPSCSNVCAPSSKRGRRANHGRVSKRADACRATALPVGISPTVDVMPAVKV
eukprot:6332149-Amphidinium_carterae.1